LIKLTVVDRAAEVHDRFARAIANEVAANNSSGKPTRLILPVGPVAQYPILAEICNRERIGWKSVYVCLMDEYLDWEGRLLPDSHSLSFRGIFQRFVGTLDEELRLPPDQLVWPDPFDIDRCEQFIAGNGGVDTCYGGVGVHGHIAFNEPPISRFGKVDEGEFLESRTRVVSLSPETIVMNATRSAGGRFADFPPMAVTVGMKAIFGASRVRLFCDGGYWQNEAIRRAISGPVSIEYPVTLLQSHADVALIADRASVGADFDSRPVSGHPTAGTAGITQRAQAAAGRG
jgi:glucosamine-6-phosphate deaminase